jgi:predicted transcriptional regulator
MPEHIDQSEQDQQEQPSLARLTTDIVAAFVANNTIISADVGNLIRAVGKGLAEISQEHEAPPLRADPIVSVRRSVARDYLVCLLCGKKQKLLRRHLSIEHNLAPDQYRKLFNLNPDYPMVAPGYAKQRAELALKIGLGKSLARATKTSARATKRASRLGGDPTTKP